MSQQGSLLTEDKKMSQKHIDLIEKVKEYTKQGYTITECAAILGCSVSHISKLKASYVKQYGWLSEEELKQLESTNTYIDQIKELYRTRKTQKQIADEIGISEITVSRTIKKSKENGTWFTGEELEEIEKRKIQDRVLAKKQKNSEQIEEIKSLIRERKSERQISEELGVSVSHISRLIHLSKTEGTWFTEEELREINITRNRVRSTTSEKNRINTEQVHKKQIEEIKTLKREGKTYAQMSEETGFSLSHISSLIRESKDAGTWLSKEELNAKRDQGHLEDLEKIKSLTSEGKEQKEISKEIGKSVVYIVNLIRKSKQEGTWFSAEELKEIRKKRLVNRSKNKKQQRKSDDSKYMEQLEEVKKLTSEGKNQKQIAEEMGISVSSISRLISQGKEDGIWLTEEEIEEIRNKKLQERNAKKKDTQKKTRLESKAQTKQKHEKHLEEIRPLFREGMSLNQIAEKLGLTNGYINNVIRESKDNGTWFTQEEIREIRNKRIAEKRTQQRSQESGTYKKQVEHIKRLTKKGKNQKQIAEELGIAIWQVQKLIEQSKEDGIWLTEDELQEINRKKEIDNEKKEAKKAKENQQQIEKIKKLYVKGKTQQEISEETGINLSYVNILIQQSKNDGIWFTEEELKSFNRKKNGRTTKAKRLEDTEKIKQLYSEGKSRYKIAKEIGRSQTYVDRIIEECKSNETWFTEQELEEINKKAKNRKYSEKTQVQIYKVKELYAEGKTQQQIAKELDVSAPIVSILIQKGKNNGTWFTGKELEEIKLKRKANRDADIELTQEDYKTIEQIKSMIRENKTLSEIRSSLSISVKKFENIRKKAIDEGIWIPKEEWDEINKQKVKQSKNTKRVKKQEEMGTEKFAEEIILLKRAGKTTDEIAVIMECSVAHILKIRKKCVENGTWISKEEEKELRKKFSARGKRNNGSNQKSDAQKAKELLKEQRRQKREEEERLKQEQALAEKLEHEKAIHKNYEIIKKLGYIEGKTSGPHVEPFKFLRKAARQEDRDEYNGEEDVSTKGRKAFIESVLKLHSLGWNGFAENDMKIITDSFYMHPELADKRIIKLVVANSAKKSGWNSAIETVQELMSSLEETKFYEELRQYSDWIKKQASIPKIKVMKSQGFTNTQIAERLRMSSAEVAILLDNGENKKEIEFD